ncbi:MAG: DUF3995 domain-containing protein [Burkholderiales bacterium]
MTEFIALFCATVFVALALWHFYMARMEASQRSIAVPSVDGKPVFTPSKKATVAVGVMLLLFALLIVATAGLAPIGVPRRWLGWMCYALALGLLARAIGEFKHVGFFKKNRGSRFAKLDTLVFSPLCLAQSAGVAFVAFNNSIYDFV